MSSLKMPIAFKIILRIFIISLCVIIVLMSTLLLSIIYEQKNSRRNLDIFSNQLFSYPLPQDTIAQDTLIVTGATSGMGNNRFYYAISMVESRLNQEDIKAHYKTADFMPAQEKSHFFDSKPILQTRVFPIADWNTLQQELCNIEDSNVFSPWESSEKNTDLYLIVLSDGAYSWWVSQELCYK